jgi:hypothetical protein
MPSKGSHPAPTWYHRKRSDLDLSALALGAGPHIDRREFSSYYEAKTAEPAVHLFLRSSHLAEQIRPAESGSVLHQHDSRPLVWTAGPRARPRPQRHDAPFSKDGH